MKLLFLVSRYPPRGIGGAERVAETLALSLQDDGHDVVVLTTDFEKDEADRTVAGVRVRTVPLRNVYDFSGPGSRALKPLWHVLDSHNPLMKSAVARVIREERPDLMHSHLVTGFSPSAWDAATELGVPVVHTLHDHYVICARSSMAVHGAACRRQHFQCALLSVPRIRAAARLSAVVGVSEYVLNRHLDLGAFRGVRSSVIPNPCHFVPSGIGNSRQPRPAGPLRFGFLGRIELNKGIEPLLATMPTMPSGDWTLAVAGSGDEQLTAELRASHADPRITFVGRVDPLRFLSEIDVLLVPSLFPETFGMSAAEALALGTPVVASTRGALPELVQDGRNGFTFDPDVPGSLAKALERVLADRGALAAMADSCRASVASLEPSLIAQRYVAVYQAALKREA